MKLQMLFAKVVSLVACSVSVRPTYAMVDSLEARCLMSAAVMAATPYITKSAQPGPAISVPASQPTSVTTSQTTSQSVPAPVLSQNANVHGGWDPNGNFVVVADGATTDIWVSEYHDYNRGAPVMSISANGYYAAMPVNFGSLTVNNNTGGTVSFSSADTQLLMDYTPSINLMSPKGTINVRSVVSVNATGYTVNADDAGFINGNHWLTGHNVTSATGGANLIAMDNNAKLISNGQIGSTFYDNGFKKVLIVDGAGDSRFYINGGGTTALGGAGNDSFKVSAYAELSRPTFIDTGDGYDNVDVSGNMGATITVTSPSGSDYVSQRTPVGFISVYSWGGESSTFVRDYSLQNDLNYNVFNTFVYYDNINGFGGSDGGKG